MRSLALAFFAIVLASGAASAQTGGSSASAEPAAAPVGTTITLTYRSAPAPLVGLAVASEVACTVTLPDGTTDSPCSRAGSLVEVRALGSGAREWTFEYAAAAPGAYAVSFTEGGVAVPPSAGAETSFEARTPPGSGEAGEPLAPGSASVAAGLLAPASDGARFLVATGASVGAILVALAGARRMGGLP